MSEVNSLFEALVEGGVTDGTQTVFYNDVQSVSSRSRRTSKDRFNYAVSFVWTILGLATLVYAVPDFNIPMSALGVLVVGSGAWMSSIFRQPSTIVEVRTGEGRKVLSFPASLQADADVGTDVAKVLNQRKGIPASKVFNDTNHYFHNPNPDFDCPGDYFDFFQLQGTRLLELSRFGEPELTNIDLSDAESAQAKLLSPKLTTLLRARDLSKHIITYCVSIERVGAPSTLHFVSFNGELWGHNPADRLCEIVMNFANEAKLETGSAS